MFLRHPYLVFCCLLTVLVLVPNFASAQNWAASLTVSPVQLQLGGDVSLEWNCPGQLYSWQYGWQYAPMPFIYAQITVNRVQEFPTSIAPYHSPPLNLGGTLPYTPPTSGTFTVILQCHYLGVPIGLGDFSCATVCRSGGQFVVTRE